MAFTTTALTLNEPSHDYSETLMEALNVCIIHGGIIDLPRPRKPHCKTAPYARSERRHSRASSTLLKMPSVPNMFIEPFIMLGHASWNMNVQQKMLPKVSHTRRYFDDGPRLELQRTVESQRSPQHDRTASKRKWSSLPSITCEINIGFCCQ